ncbi:MAG: ABC transporter ATP-binding protein/permease, partial [Chloroflexi bacterium]|nr:ABC transporter ATP-binding protein/permease [Chloroflexota bacterium]
MFLRSVRRTPTPGKEDVSGRPSELVPIWNRPTFRITRDEIRRSAAALAGLFVLILLGTALALASPLLFRTLIDRAIPSRNFSLVWKLLLGMVLTPLVSLLVSGLQDYLRSEIGEGVNIALKRELMRHILAARVGDLEKMRSGDVCQRILSGAGEIGRVYIKGRLLPVMSNGILLAGNLAVMADLNWRLLLVTLLAVPPSLYVSGKVAKRSAHLDSQFRELLEDAQGAVNEIVLGARTIRAFNGQEREAARWDAWLLQYRSVVSRSSALHNVVLTLPADIVNNVVLGLVMGVGAYQSINGRMSIGSLVAFVAYIPRFYGALKALLDAHIGTAGALATAESLDAVFALGAESASGVEFPAGADLDDTERADRPVIHAEAVCGPSGRSIEFRNVSFTYGRGDFDLQDVSFRVEPGEFVGIVGGTGGGKSTIIDLLLRFCEPDAGQILVDEIPINALSVRSLRAEVALAPQDPFLWNASLRENILYPEGLASDEALRARARAAQLQDLIARLPAGFDTAAGERGAALSGGERQRIALARA